MIWAEQQKLHGREIERWDDFWWRKHRGRSEKWRVEEGRGIPRKQPQQRIGQPLNPSRIFRSSASKKMISSRWESISKLSSNFQSVLRFTFDSSSFLFNASIFFSLPLFFCSFFPFRLWVTFYNGDNGGKWLVDAICNTSYPLRFSISWNSITEEITLDVDAKQRFHYRVFVKQWRYGSVVYFIFLTLTFKLNRFGTCIC